jgi:hypothetical protein
MKTFTVVATNEITDNLFRILERTSNPIIVLDSISQAAFEGFEAASHNHNPNTVLIRVWANNCYVGRNAGIEYALNMGATDILFIDSDCVPYIEWEREMLSGKGKIKVGWTEEITENENLNNYAINYPIGLGTNGIKYIVNGLRIIPTCNAGYSAEVFRTLGLFPLEMSSDTLFSQRAIAHYGIEQVSLCCDARIKHYLAKDMPDLLRKKMRYAKSSIGSIWVVPFWVIGSIGVSLFFTVRGFSYKQVRWKELFTMNWISLLIDLAVAWGRVKIEFIKYKNIW